MASRSRRFAARAAILGIILATSAAAAWAQADTKKPNEKSMGEVAQAVLAKVRPAIVEIWTEYGNNGTGVGGGVVVDAAKGLIATNFHVINHAISATAAFALDPDGKRYAIDGFVAAMPGNDVAILHIQAGGRKLVALKLADKNPEPGDTVYVVAPAERVLGGPVSRGMVTATRSGQELAEIWDGRKGKGFFKTVVRYDADGTWLQHSAAIGEGTFGGPLLNARGEVLGLNTFIGFGCNVNFAVSARHLRAALAKASETVTSLSKVPDRAGPPKTGINEDGSANRNMAAWMQLNAALGGFDKKLAEAQKNLDAIGELAPGGTANDIEAHHKKTAAAYKQFAATYAGLAGRIKANDAKQVHRALVAWLRAQGDLLDGVGKSYEGLALRAAAGAKDAESSGEETAEHAEYALWELRDDYEGLRRSLCESFAMNFPGVEDSQRDKMSGGFRVWTSSDGNFQVEAKLIGVTDNGRKAQLKKVERQGGFRALIEALS